jgi:hypothetical protein
VRDHTTDDRARTEVVRERTHVPREHTDQTENKWTKCVENNMEEEDWLCVEED